MTSGANPLTPRATGAKAGTPLTPVIQLRAFVDAFERLGYVSDRLLADIGVQRSLLDDPDALIPCATTEALVKRALRDRPLKNVGVCLATQTPIGAWGLLDYLILTSDSVGQGLSQLARYLRMLTGAPFLLELREDGDPVLVVYHGDASAGTFGLEYSVALTVLHIREETGRRAAFACVSFTHQLEDVVEIERDFGCTVTPGASWAGFAMPRESWNMPLLRKDPLLHRVLQGHADSITSDAFAVDDLAGNVRRALVTRLADGEIAIEAIARQLGMATRTLQRRLAGAGLSFHGLLDDTRRDVAERCITHSSLSIGEIAYLLGYSEPAAFHRAFKRWSGATPQAFRQRQRSNRLTVTTRSEHPKEV